jgi:hypothetical protein
VTGFEIVAGLRSGCTYAGARILEEFHERARRELSTRPVWRIDLLMVCVSVG